VNHVEGKINRVSNFYIKHIFISVKRPSKVSRTRQDSSRTNDGHADDDDLSIDTEEQDIRFIDVPSTRSRPGSKVKRSPGSADGRQTADNGKKPYKTIDPEEIVSRHKGVLFM